jgi:hypothetical protein
MDGDAVDGFSEVGSEPVSECLRLSGPIAIRARRGRRSTLPRGEGHEAPADCMVAERQLGEEPEIVMRVSRTS